MILPLRIVFPSLPSDAIPPLRLPLVSFFSQVFALLPVPPLKLAVGTGPFSLPSVFSLPALSDLSPNPSVTYPGMRPYATVRAPGRRLCLLAAWLRPLTGGPVPFEWRPYEWRLTCPRLGDRVSLIFALATGFERGAAPI